MFPLEFRGKVYRQEIRAMGLSYSEDRMNSREWGRCFMSPMSNTTGARAR